jgi:hypothetical protein
MGVNCGIKTATNIPSTVGVATGRKYLRLTNESLDMRCRAGASNISNEAGVIIEPGQTVEFSPIPLANTNIYVMSEGKAVKLAYYEVIA